MNSESSENPVDEQLRQQFERLKTLFEEKYQVSYDMVPNMQTAQKLDNQRSVSKYLSLCLHKN
eukprot:TRINITY_DN7542_c0_g1_i1.p1 TRINITY_DN7542_c0_g1~~TRINITY_DN7542_c0_g1_i1.p1  ORF type:complete len:63 (+),score=15.44 TRINITY_DN7542_c0_g1_i1:30-218(+)